MAIWRSMSHQELVEYFMSAQENDPAARREMAAVFQAANRRIQNLETSMAAGRIGYSPAYGAVIEYTGHREGRFSKFHMVGSWDKMLEQTAQALAFMQEPTSTASGARKWQRELAASLSHKNGSPIEEQEMSRFMKAVYGEGTESAQFKSIAERYVLANTEMAVGDAYNDMATFIDDYVERVEEEKRRKAENMADYYDALLEQMNSMLIEGTSDAINGVIGESFRPLR